MILLIIITVCILQFFEPTLIYRSETRTNSITDVTFHPIKNVVAFIDGGSIVDNGFALFYEVEVSEFVDFAGRIPASTRIVFSHDGNNLFTGSREGDIRIFNLETGEQINQFSANNEVIEAIDVSEDGQYIAVASTNSVIGVGTYAFSLFHNTGEVILQRDLSQGDGVATAFIDSKNLVVYSTLLNSDIGKVWALDINTGEEIASCDGNRRVRDILPFSDGEFVFYSADDGIRKWDLRDCEAHPDAWSLFTEIPENHFVNTIALNPSETILAVGGRKYLNPGGEGFIHFFDVTTGELLKVIEIPFTDADNDYPTINALAFSPDGTLLASGGADGTVRLWGIPAGEGD